MKNQLMIESYLIQLDIVKVCFPHLPALVIYLAKKRQNTQLTDLIASFLFVHISLDILIISLL